jgi:hypothetical protein
MKKLLISALTAAALLLPNSAMAAGEKRSAVFATFAVLGCYVQDGNMTEERAGQLAIEYFNDNGVPLDYAMSVMNEPGFASEVVDLVQESGGCREILK